VSVDQQDRDQHAGESGWQPHPHPSVQPKKRHRVRTTLLVLAGILAAVVALVTVAGNNAEDTVTTAPTPTQSAPSEPTEKPSLTAEQQNAVEQAESYLDLFPFSRKLLINQLVHGEKFARQDATVAVDSMDINYNEQAAISAKRYLEDQSFSRAGLVQQLMHGDLYTHSQAEYGVNQTELAS
jgi:hypothetical protein